MPNNSRQIREPQRPAGWPVASFNTYTEAQTAVDSLSDRQFPVEHLTIVGVDLVQVENVTGRLTWGKVLGGGALSGIWIGLFFGILMSLLTPQFWAPLLYGIIIGAIFGLIFAAVSYGLSGGRRDFTSHTSIVAGRYDILSAPEHAERARDMIASQGAAPRQSPQENPQQPPQGHQGPGQQQHPEN